MDYINRIKEKNSQGKYSLFSTDTFKNCINTPSMSIYFDILKDWDNDCNLPIELGEFLNEATRSNQDLVAFSRVYIGELKNNGEIASEEISDIATYGLINNGHVNSSGANQELHSPSECLSPLYGIEGWINLVGRYKRNNAIILYSLPKKYIDNRCYFKDKSKANMIYNFSGNLTYIKPEFLIGMIIKNKDVPDLFLTREDMLQMSNKRTR